MTDRPFEEIELGGEDDSSRAPDAPPRGFGEEDAPPAASSHLRVTGQEPYRILLINDFAAAGKGKLSGPLVDGVAEASATNFDDLLRQSAPRLELVMKDPMPGGSAMVQLDLCFDSLRSFDPDNLARQIPAANECMGLRDVLVDRMSGKKTAQELAAHVVGLQQQDGGRWTWVSELMKPPAGGRSAGAKEVDSVLSQLDLGEGESDAGQSPPPQKPSSVVGSMVSSVASGGGVIPGPEVAGIRRVLSEIDRRIGIWLTAVLHADPVRSMESAWRGLAFLVSQIDFRKGVKLSVLHAGRDAMVERFDSLVVGPAFDEGQEAPALVVVDMAFGNSAPEMEVIDGLAQHAASLPAALFVGGAPAFLGTKQAWQVASLPPLMTMFDQWQFAKWKALRKQHYATKVGVFFGRCLLRGAHEPGETKDLKFAYQEPCMKDDDFVWCSGALAAGCTVARSFADTGWPSAMAGMLHGRIAGLPVSHAGKDGEKKIGPTDTALKQERVHEMGSVGLNAVVGLKEGDTAVVWNGITAAYPRRPEASAIFEISLPYQLFAGRLSALLWQLRPHLQGLPEGKIQYQVAEHISGWLGAEELLPPEQLNVLTREAENDPGALELAVTIVPPPRLLPGGVPVILGLKIPRM